MPKKKPLHVFLRGQHIGVLDALNPRLVQLRFDRDADLNAVVSMSMPTVPGKRAPADATSAFFNGLLPDGSDARLTMAKSFDSLDTSTVSLLRHGGLDCAGALQVYTQDTLPERPSQLAPITDADISSRLQALAGDEEMLRDDMEHWSLSGAQRKIAVARDGGQWFLPTGAAATTHIIKPGVGAIPGVSPGQQAFTEHVTMRAAAAVGVDVARTEFAMFDATPAIVVERFDRLMTASGTVRIHQEDMCQALAVDSSIKYEVDGGPGVRAVADLVRDAVADRTDAETDVRRFARMVAFNYMVEGSDAHAKNYALLHPTAGEAALAPMFDAATGAIASTANGTRRFPKASMQLGNRWHFGAATGDDWAQFLAMLGLTGDSTLIEELIAMAERVTDALSDALNDTTAPQEFRNWARSTPVLTRVQQSARAAHQALTQLPDNGRRTRPYATMCGTWMPAWLARCSAPRGHEGWPLAGHQ
ncbi:HipA domain-containing protein [Demequina sp. B12]|uniref:HipA domain-containing protein n=1 Tax=Demequina sp. B12 TaxID=2992757 RepID=UPI00237A1CF8|nr:HipA domain-containing protein [Demequina sp. B12]MDE0573469.1 HipA domain-containing protein [Demequina sp. B12]